MEQPGLIKLGKTTGQVFCSRRRGYPESTQLRPLEMILSMRNAYLPGQGDCDKRPPEDEASKTETGDHVTHCRELGSKIPDRKVKMITN